MATTAQAPETRPGRASLGPALAVLVVLVAGALAGFAGARQLVADQERRLLAERADEVGALLTSSIDSIDSSLRVLGPVGASPDRAAMGLFKTSAGQLLEGTTTAVGVATEQDGRFTVVASVGEGAEIGDQLEGERAAVAARASATDELASGLVPGDRETGLVFARPVAGARAVAFRESVVDPSRPSPSTPESPFRGLEVLLYASPDADPAQLVVTTTADPDLTGPVSRQLVEVGGDRWLAVVGARGSVVGSFAERAPWLLLGVGLVLAALAAATVGALTHRRGYALALVEKRTRELEQTLGELGETRAFLEGLLTAGPVVVGRTSVTDQRVTYTSPNVERILGHAAEVVTEAGFLAAHVHPEDLPAVGAAMARVADGSSEQETLTYRLRCGDGTYRWLEATLRGEVEGDRVVGVLAYILEVDARRRAELAQREAQETAQAANQAKSEFLSRMSHELRTPLNAVLGFGQLLELEDLDESQHDAIGHIMKAGRHLLDLINEVLDISRVESGDLALSPEPVLAVELVQEAADLIGPLAVQNEIQLVVDRSRPCDAYAFADRQRAKQVLLNLLSNAVKYNRARGTVAVACERRPGERVAFSVTDTGAGIPAERLGLLFTPFERLGAEHTAVEGTGIGLTLSKRLAEAMGGTLEVSSTLGQGTTFTLELPEVEGPVERYERLNDVPAPNGARAGAGRDVVLHIEDNLANLTLVDRVLAQRPGVEVVAAMQGRLGLELARQHHPVLVLLDLHLPDIGGEQVLHRLRDDPATASTPVVIVSADATPGQVQRLLNAGAAGYLTKPLDVGDLLDVVDKAVGDHRAGDGPPRRRAGDGPPDPTSPHPMSPGPPSPGVPSTGVPSPRVQSPGPPSPGPPSTGAG